MLSITFLHHSFHLDLSKNTIFRKHFFGTKKVKIRLQKMSSAATFSFVIYLDWEFFFDRLWNSNDVWMTMMWSRFLTWRWSAVISSLLVQSLRLDPPLPEAGHSWLRWNKRWRWQMISRWRRPCGARLRPVPFILKGPYMAILYIILFQKIKSDSSGSAKAETKEIQDRSLCNKWGCSAEKPTSGLTQRSTEEGLDFVGPSVILCSVTLNMKHFQRDDLSTTMDDMKTGRKGKHEH